MFDEVDRRVGSRQAGALFERVEDVRRRLLVEEVHARSARAGPCCCPTCFSSCDTSRSVRVRNGVRPMSPRPFTNTGIVVQRVDVRADRRAAAAVDERADLRAERQRVGAVQLHDVRTIGRQPAERRRGCRANPTSSSSRSHARFGRCCPGARCCRPAAARSPS